MAITSTEVNLCNMSLGRIGAKQITYSTSSAVTSLPEYAQCQLHYEQTRNSLLRSCEWNFAVKRLALVGTWTASTTYTTDQYVWYGTDLYKCATANSDATWTVGKWTITTTRPSFGYAYQYSLPTDLLRFRGADLDETYGTISAFSYAVEGKLFLTDEQTVNIEYIYKVEDTTVWDSLFYDCMVLKLALNILHPLAGTSVVPMRQALEQELRELLSKARTITKQETNSSGSSDWNNARYL